MTNYSGSPVSNVTPWLHNECSGCKLDLCCGIATHYSDALPVLCVLHTESPSFSFQILLSRCNSQLCVIIFFFYCREDLIHIVDFTSTDGIAHPYINVCARRAWDEPEAELILVSVAAPSGWCYKVGSQLASRYPFAGPHDRHSLELSQDQIAISLSGDGGSITLCKYLL